MLLLNIGQGVPIIIHNCLNIWWELGTNLNFELYRRNRSPPKKKKLRLMFLSYGQLTKRSSSADNIITFRSHVSNEVQTLAQLVPKSAMLSTYTKKRYSGHLYVKSNNLRRGCDYKLFRSLFLSAADGWDASN